jgi:sodium/potassium/calcium exchanger 2
MKNDCSVKKRTPKVGMRLTILLGGVFTIGLYKFMGGRFPGESVEVNPDGLNDFDMYSSLFHRNLAETNDTCTDPSIQDSICIGYGADACKRLGDDQMYAIFFIVLALLYLFVGIAIVCDELFVPALEIIAEDLQLSNDVAGATLMAAGGSAPELATSFVGVFKRSDVGFGTIVGSAVFNVLFVISMCVMFTPDKYSPLELTWWPLFRDCSYYVVTLATLAIFMYDGQIEPWEAIVQFLLYFGYVGMMSKSEQLEAYLTAKFIKKDGQVSPGTLLLPFLSVFLLPINCCCFRPR